jgi:hypothetical protein
LPASRFTSGARHVVPPQPRRFHVKVSPAPKMGPKEASL